MPFDAVVFPGQGAQKQGMARDFVEQFDEAKSVFEIGTQTLAFDPVEICFEDGDKLNQTAYTQPCIVLAEAAMYNTLKARYSLSPAVFGGHSLGEYAALYAADVLPLELLLTLVSKRGELMQNTPVDGGMAALIMESIPYDALSELSNEYDIDVANDNSVTQVVLSGDKQKLDTLIEKIEHAFDDARVVKLNVSAPFHSRHMKDIEETFYDFLAEHKSGFSVTGLSNVVSNFLGGFYSGKLDELLMALSKQLSGAVKWRDNMAAITQKANSILELGPNRPLRGFFKTLGVDITSVVNAKQAEKVFSHETI